jgi:hypothetical protein
MLIFGPDSFGGLNNPLWKVLMKESNDMNTCICGAREAIYVQRTVAVKAYFTEAHSIKAHFTLVVSALEMVHQSLGANMHWRR